MQGRLVADDDCLVVNPQHMVLSASNRTQLVSVRQRE
jgi:hypothetical protein